MDNKPTIFISHSTGQLPENDHCVLVRKALVTALAAKGWNVFLDSLAIEAGNLWRADILHNLATAQACIILLNEAAGNSSWVKAEALIMCFRKSMDPSFPVVPIVFPDAQLDATFLKTYEPFEFNEIQRVAVNFETGGSPEALAQKIAEIPALQASMHAPPNCTAWVQDVADLLVGLKPPAFNRTVPPLKLDLAANALADDAAQSMRLGWAVANLMHQADANDCYEAFAKLISALSSEHALRLRRYLASKWVMNESVEMLLHALRRPDTHGWLVLNTSSLKIVECYQDRASIEVLPRGATIYKISVSAPKGEFEKPEPLIALVEDALMEHFLTDEMKEAGLERDSLPAVVAKYFEPANCFAVCLLPVNFNRANVISVLRGRYERIVFLILAGNKSTQLPAEARPLKPLLVADNLIEFAVFGKRCNTLIDDHLTKSTSP